MKRIWIKLYLEILNDPKMGQLPDWLWRRAIELFLLAGENGNDGLLQPVTDLAWRLRPCSEEQVAKSLRALAEVGVVHETPEGWMVTHFSKRQEALTSTERSRYSRARNDCATKRCNNGNDYATAEENDSSSTSSSNSPSSSDSGERVQGEGKVFTAYEKNIGVLTPAISDGLKADIDDYSAAWVITAIEYAARHEKRSLAYVTGCLKGWKRDGLANPPAADGGGKPKAKSFAQKVMES